MRKREKGGGGKGRREMRKGKGGEGREGKR